MTSSHNPTESAIDDRTAAAPTAAEPESDSRTAGNHTTPSAAAAHPFAADLVVRRLASGHSSDLSEGGGAGEVITMAQLPMHWQAPEVRRVDGHLVDLNGRSVVALQDIAQMVSRPCVVSREAIVLIEQFDGRTHLSDLVDRFHVPVRQLVALVRHLDEHLLLRGPRFEAFVAQMRQEYDARASLPIRAAGGMTDGMLARALDAVPPRSAAGVIEGLVVPHLDFERGQRTYAAGWRYVRDHIGPGGVDRVLILGTNHFGQATGAVLCDRGLDTTLGVVHVDREFVEAMQRADRGIVRRMLEHRLDNAREHSLELQGPWIRHVLGPDVRVVGLLMHDPTIRQGASYDGRGVSFDQAMGVVRAALADAGGRTLIVASADLSHVGTDFGDDRPNTAARLDQVAAHDHEHLELLRTGKLATFLDSMARRQNPTRWCTIGGMAALWTLLPDARPRLLQYEQSSDDLESGGACCVTSAAMSLERRSAAAGGPGGSAGRTVAG